MSRRLSPTASELQHWFAPDVEEALAELGGERDPLVVAEHLRRRLPRERIAPAAALHRMRLRSSRVYPSASPRFGTPEALEQSSREEVALHRAARVREAAPGALCADLTCGLGVDAWALGRAGLSVVACDHDPFRARCARENLAGSEGVVGCLVADARRPAVRADLCLLDPDRRPAGRRERDPARWAPSLAETLRAAARFDGACVKLAPALDPVELAGDLPATDPLCWEWISSRGELAELCLWLGGTAATGDEVAAQRRATVIDRDGRAHGLCGPVVETPALPPTDAADVAWLVDPDPAVVRSGLLGRMARDLGMRPIAPRCAYLAGDREPRTPLGRVFRVLGSAAVDRRRVRELLARFDVGPLTVKKRGHPEPAEALARRLAGRGSERGVLVVARLERGHRAFLVEPVL